MQQKAGKIIVVDINQSKKAWADKFGATDFVNSADLRGQTIQEKLIEMTDGGCYYTFDCTGNVGVMRAALEACHKGWGQIIVIGVAAAGQEVSTRRKFHYVMIKSCMCSNSSSIPSCHRSCVEGMFSYFSCYIWMEWLTTL